MKKFIEKIRTVLTLAITSVMATPVAVSAADLQNAQLDANGQLVIQGAAMGESGNGGLIAAFNTLMDKANVIVAGVSGVLTVVMVGLFIWKCFQFAQSSSNPSQRASAITGIIVFAIAAALFGSATLFVGLAYNLFG